MAQTNERIQQLIGIAQRKNTIAAVLIAGLCLCMGTLALVYATKTGGVVFGVLFFVVGVLALFSILRVDGGKLRVVQTRVRESPELVAWIHLSSIANRLRRREATLIVFFMDRTYVRFALRKDDGHELIGLLRTQCPLARFTEELPLPALLAHEVQWRKNPEAFRRSADLP